MMTLNPKKNICTGLHKYGDLNRGNENEVNSHNTLLHILFFFWSFYVKTLQEINLSLQNSCSSNPCPQNVTCLNGFTDKGYIGLTSWLRGTKLWRK